MTTNPLLQQMIRVINKITKAERIYLLGEWHATTGNNNIFGNSMQQKTVLGLQMLIILSDEEKRFDEELQNMIETAARPVTKLAIILIPLKVFNSWLVNGHLFAHSVVNKDCLIWSNEATVLATQGVYCLDSLEKKILREFGEWTARAEDFMYGVQSLLAAGKLYTAVFMLHQVAEFTYMAIIRLVTGYRQVRTILTGC